MKREQAARAANERNAYIAGLLANTNLDDGKNTKKNVLQDLDIQYHETLRSIYNSNSEEIEGIKEDPLFSAIKVPGRDIPVEDSPDIDRTTENLEEPQIEVDQL